MKRVLIILVLMLLACGGETAIQQAAQAPTKAPEQPSAEAVEDDPPTATPEPPTATPEPTATPDLSFEPIELSGSGDSVVNVEKPQVPAIIEISGNDESRFFSVESVNAEGETLNLLVNATELYHGIRPLDFGRSAHTTRLQVSAPGGWSAVIRPLSAAKHLTVPGSISGTGDDVIVLEGATPDLATISGNQAERYFGVTGYGDSFPDLIVNTTNPYSGQSIVESSVVVLEVQAVGDWSIEISGK